ncbi:N-acetylmannosamine kinase [Acidimicrobiaceae bacterium]|nr:N-acetylmannosamine kinase [Acidimicrobiaceae bacterium]
MSARGYFAVDIGGTKLSVGVVSLTGEVLSHGRAATPQTNVWQALSELIEAQLALTDVELVSCGVGCGGPMSPGGEFVSTLHIPEWRDFPLRAKLQALMHLPVYIDNDAKALVQGEVWCGAVAGQTDVIGMVVSTGVGGGIISGGKILNGRIGNAGHIGHVIVEPNGRLCACGSHGCLEAHASGRSIEAITGKPAAEASLEVIQNTGRLVARALTSVGAIIDLRSAVIAGSVALGFGDPFFDTVQNELDRNAKIEFIRDFTVCRAGLGQLSPLVGAAAVARNLGCNS